MTTDALVNLQLNMTALKEHNIKLIFIYLGEIDHFSPIQKVFQLFQNISESISKGSTVQALNIVFLFSKIKCLN